MLALHHWWVVSYSVLLQLVVMIRCKISCIYNKSLVVLLKIRILDRFFFMVCNKISGAYGETHCSYKIEGSCYCLLLKGKIFFIINLYKWSVFLVFRMEGIFYGLYSSRWCHLLHSFSYVVMDPPVVLFVAKIRIWFRTNFEEGKYCAYEVFKHRNCRGKKLGC